MGEPADRVGTVVAGRYRVVARLGAGAMGVVYRAERVDAERAVAIKFIQDPSPDLAARFQREIAAASRLSHPHLAEIVDSGVVDATPFLVMELCEGDSLGRLLERGALPGPRAVGIALQLLAGIEHAHRGGVVHRDLKPDNVMLLAPAERDFVKVLDFGLAKIVRGDGDKELLTLRGVTMGTPSYIAPEQARAEPVDRRADLYSLGVMLYQMVTGQRPFVGASAAETVRLHLTTAPAPPREVPGVAPCSLELERVILRALEKAPERRWQTAAEFAAALSETPEGRALEDVALHSAPEIRRARVDVSAVRASTVPPPAPASRGVQRLPAGRTALLAAGAIIAVLLALIALLRR